MMRKLYSVEKDEDSTPDAVSFMPSPKNEGNSGRTRLKKKLEEKQAFDYSWQEFTRNNLCSCCCCCRHKSTTKDRLFVTGRSKLWAEMDLLNIIKQLRTNKFTSQSYLKPHQVALIRWFEEYTLFPVNQED
jgi:hypothetical protein